MDKDTKTIHFIVPRVVYEEFYRCFPGRGEMKSFFMLSMMVGIEIMTEGNPLGKKLKERLEEGL